MRRKYRGDLPFGFQNYITDRIEDHGTPPTVAEIAERYNVHPHKVERAIDDARVGRRLCPGVVPEVVPHAQTRYRSAIAECANLYGNCYDEKDIAKAAGVDEGLIRRWVREFGARRETPPPTEEVVDDLFSPVDDVDVSQSARLLYYVLVSHEIRRGEILSRPEMAWKLGRSVSLVEKLLRELRDAGLISRETLRPGPIPSGPSDDLTADEERQLGDWWYWWDVTGNKNHRLAKVLNLKQMAEIWEVSFHRAKEIAHNLERKGWIEIDMKRRPTHLGKRKNRGSYVTLLKHPTETWRQPASNY